MTLVKINSIDNTFNRLVDDFAQVVMLKHEDSPGLAKLTQGASSQTAADSILGTPLYMSPEQAFGESVDQRSDLFSLGTVLYELLTGRQPFTSENYMGVIQNIIHKEIPSVREINPEVPPEIEMIVMRALAKNRDERFGSAREFREAIEQSLGHEALARATSALPALLDREAATRILSKKEVTPKPAANATRKPAANAVRNATSSSQWRTVSSMKKRQRSGAPVWVVAPVIALALGGAATWFFWPRIQAAGILGLSGEVQQAGLGETGFSTPPVAADSSSVDSSLAPVTNAAPPAETTAVAPPALVPVANTADTTAKQVEVAEKKVDAPKEEEKPAETAVVTKPKPRGEVEKPFREGFLMLNVEPSAQVYVNGVYRGEASPTLRLTLPVGLFSVECRAEQHDSYLESIRIVHGEMSQRTIALRKLMGTISLATTEGAELYVDGKFIGITPIMRPIEIPAGLHTLTIKKDNHFTWSSDVTIAPNATLPLRITLSPRY